MARKTQREKIADARARRERADNLFRKRINRDGLASVLWDKHGAPLVDEYREDTEDRQILEDEYTTAEDSLDRGERPVWHLALSMQRAIENEAAALLARAVLFNGLPEARCQDFDEVVAYLEAWRRKISDKLVDIVGTTTVRTSLWRSAVDEPVHRAHADFVDTIDDVIKDIRKAQSMGCTNIYGE